MNTSIHAVYKTNRDKEVEGVWYKADGDLEFLIARMGGANEKAMLEATSKFYLPFADKINNNELSNEEVEKISLRAFSHICIKGWKNVKEEVDGEMIDIEYCPEKMTDILVDLPELQNELINFAQNRDSFKDNLGNS